LPRGDRLILRGDFHYESPTQIQQVLPGLSSSPLPQSLPGFQVSAAPASGAQGPAPFRAEVNEVNASLTLALHSGLEFTLWGRNITNDRYLLTVFDSNFEPYAVSGYANQPRTYGGTVRFRY
jgi:outer membrane receptor protein involved in Fe transport